MQETKALISAMTGESRGGSRAAAPGCGFSRGASPDYSEDDKMTMKSCMYQVKIHDLQLSEENTFYVKQYISP